MFQHLTCLHLQYPNMVCVEAGYVAKPYTLPAGKLFVASQTLQILS